MWSRFWYCSDTAGPGLLDVARVWDREPRVLRQHNRSKPDPWVFGKDIYIQPVKLQPTHAAQVADFWREHYGGSDWWLDATDEWVREVLAHKATMALGLFQKGTGNLLGTIVSRPAVQESAYILVGEYASLQDARVIEGLCIHKDQRGHHLAGWLIAWMDYWTHSLRPTVHFWFREVGAQAPTTEVTRATWAYARISELPTSSLALRPLTQSEFTALWEASVPTWRHAKVVLGSKPFMDNKNSDCWDIWQHENQIVVLLNTRRRTRPANEPIWEVAWCGEVRQGLLYPGLRTAQLLIEAAAQQGKREGLVFVTDEPHRGGASSAWQSLWHFGTSGMQLTYVYNYMPPAFWNCEVQLLRDEL